MQLNDIPGRIFLDTSVVNFLLDFGEEIHDGIAPSTDLDKKVTSDITALYNLFLIGQRASWQLAISPFTYFEISNTRDENRRNALKGWFNEIWLYWRDIIHQDKDMPSFVEAEETRIGILMSDALDAIPDNSDCVLICDAITYRCKLFVTRDWTTILKNRAALRHLPIRFVTPTEWWEEIRPFASLWI